VVVKACFKHEFKYEIEQQIWLSEKNKNFSLSVVELSDILDSGTIQTQG
jgi:hypothetical protein